MSRIRSIKPEWLDDDRLLECSDQARVLTVALILLADDSGRGRWGVASKARAFPRDPRLADSAFGELAPWFARRYEVRGQVYFEIGNWSKHQRIDRASKPRTPDPSEGVWIDVFGASSRGLVEGSTSIRTVDIARDPGPNEALGEADSSRARRGLASVPRVTDFERGGITPSISPAGRPKDPEESIPGKTLDEDSTSIHTPGKIGENPTGTPPDPDDTREGSSRTRRGLASDRDLDLDLDLDQGPRSGPLIHSPPPPQDPSPPTRARTRARAAAADSVTPGDTFDGERLRMPLGEATAETLLDAFEVAWAEAREEVGVTHGASNRRRARAVLSWLAGFPVEQRAARLAASVSGAVARIEGADSPVAVWASDPGRFERAHREAGADEDDAAAVRAAARVAELVAEADALADSDDSGDLDRLEAIGRQIEELRRHG